MDFKNLCSFLPYILVFSLSENPFIRSDLRSKIVCASLLKGKCYRFRILRGFTPDIL